MIATSCNLEPELNMDKPSLETMAGKPCEPADVQLRKYNSNWIGWMVDGVKLWNNTFRKLRIIFYSIVY